MPSLGASSTQLLAAWLRLALRQARSTCSELDGVVNVGLLQQVRGRSLCVLKAHALQEADGLFRRQSKLAQPVKYLPIHV
jgi:hypothetical protein